MSPHRYISTGLCVSFVHSCQVAAQHTDQSHVHIFHKEETHSHTSLRAFEAGSVWAPEKKDQWMAWMAAAFNTSYRLATNQNTLRGLALLYPKGSLDEMSGDTKRCRGKVFMIQWLNSTLLWASVCVCVFICGNHWFKCGVYCEGDCWGWESFWEHPEA